MTEPDEDYLDDHALPPRSLAEYHARYLLNKHGLTPPLTFAEVAYICRQEGMRLEIDPYAEHEGVYNGGREPYAVLRYRDPRAAGHELGHYCWHGQAEYCVQLYCTWWKATGEERFCEEFADLLTQDPADLNAMTPYGAEDWYDEG